MLSLAALALAVGLPAYGETLSAPLALATPTGPGASLGSITISESPGGAVFHLDLHGLPPGQHGFHVHSSPSCAPGQKDGAQVPAGGAGGHLDPAATGMHMGPGGGGHLGDLPYLTVGADGTATGEIVAPQIKTLADLKGHALVIHAGGDNYADQPKPLGGGGARLACGVIIG